MGILLAFPVIFILIMLQTTVFNQITLLSGFSDIVLLWVCAWAIQPRVKSAWFWMILAGVVMALMSSIPWYIPVISYSIIIIFARQLIKRVWQSPLLLMFLVTILGSLIFYGLTYVILKFTNISIPLNHAIVQVIIPSILLNLLFSLPIFAIAKDTAEWVYPLEVTE